MEWTKRFCWWIYHFSVSLTLAVLQRQKSYRILAVLPFKMSAPSLSCEAPWSLASTPWTMSLYFKFRAIYFWLLNEYQRWDQAKMYHIIRQLIYRFMWEIMTRSDDKTKLIHKNFPQEYDYELLNPKQNENSHYNGKDAEAVKPKSEVQRSGTISHYVVR